MGMIKVPSPGRLVEDAAAFGNISADSISKKCFFLGQLG